MYTVTVLILGRLLWSNYLFIGRKLIFASLIIKFYIHALFIYLRISF